MRSRLMILLILIVISAVGWWSWRDAGVMASIVEQDRELRQFVESHSVVAPIFGFVIYFLLSLIPGTTGKAIIYGWLFGFWTAILISTLSLSLAAVVTLLVVRGFFRESIERRLSKLIRRIDCAIDRHGPTYLLSLRLLHMPYTLTNYATGATAVPAFTFAWTTFLGMLPGTAVFVLAGSELPSLAVVARQGVWSIIDLRLLLAFSLLAFLPIFVKTLRHFFINPEQS